MCTYYYSFVQATPAAPNQLKSVFCFDLRVLKSFADRRRCAASQTARPKVAVLVASQAFFALWAVYDKKRAWVGGEL